MAQYPIQTNYTAGELSPRLSLRVDFNKYANGLESLVNYKVLPQGGITRRDGTHFVNEVKDSTKETRLIPFEYSTLQAYQIEAGNLYFRFYKDNGQVLSTLSVANAADNGAGLIRITTTNPHGLQTGNTVDISTVLGTVEANGTWVITVIDTTNFDLVGSTFVNAYTSSGIIFAIVEIATPYLEADLFDLKFAQSADTLYIVHPSYAPRKLTRSSHTAWTLTTITFIDGPYLDQQLLEPNGQSFFYTLTPDAATGSGVTLTANSSMFVSTDVGRLVRMQEGSVWGYALITGYTSGTVVTITVINTLTDTTSKGIWQLGAWTTTLGYPGAITFFEERLVFGGSTSQPQTVWASMSGDYEDMTPGANDDSALVYTIASNQVNTILWLASSNHLLIGTVGAEFAMFGGNNDAPLTPTNVTVKKQGAYGSFGNSPVAVGTSVLFIQRSGKKIRQLQYDAQGSNAYSAPDLTLLAEHITAPFIIEMAYQQEPDTIVWCVRSDGVLVSMTFNPTQDVIAFARHTTDGLFESVSCIPSADGLSDETWMIVNRTIDEVTKRYIEYFDPNLQVDSGLTYEGVAVGSVDGLVHLDAKVVDIVGNGAVYPQDTVTAETVQLDGPDATVIQVGLPYDSSYVTLRPEVQMRNGGTSQGQFKRWVNVSVRLYQSLGLTINGDDIETRSSADDMDEPPPLFSGDVKVSVAGGWSRAGQLTIAQTQPLPSTILGHFGTVDVGGESE